jgi:copper chaperone NosL
MMHREHVRSFLPMLVLAAVAGCTPSELRPVELFAEDACAMCRMAVSDPAFASEILTTEGDVLKFDDLRCMENYRREHATVRIGAIFVKDYETRAWLPYERSVIIRTSIDTPMGSGTIAASSAEQARRLTEAYPPDDTGVDACCATGKAE